jgi:hypothetical protein
MKQGSTTRIITDGGDVRIRVLDGGIAVHVTTPAGLDVASWCNPIEARRISRALSTAADELEGIEKSKTGRAGPALEEDGDLPPAV